MKIKGSTFIISGGSSGLGEATTIMLYQNGANVAIFDIKENEGEKLVESLGSRAIFLKTDITDEDQVERSIKKTVEHFGPIHGCINCAGVVSAFKVLNKGISSMTTKVFETTIKINLTGSFILSKLCAQQMATQEPVGEDNERGVIILTSSISTYEGQQGQSAYASSKGGVASMTLPLSRELGDYGIRVMTIAPGVFETPMSGLMSDRVKKSLLNDCVYPKRFGKPKEFANLVLFIIENVMLNGSVIRLDGSSRLSKL